MKKIHKKTMKRWFVKIAAILIVVAMVMSVFYVIIQNLI